jgi:hypothetical protein
MLKQISYTTAALISVSVAKDFLKIGYTTDDILIETILKTSEFICENIIHKSIQAKSFEQYIDGYDFPNNKHLTKIKLLNAPIVGTPTVTIYELYDSTGAAYTNFRMVDNVMYPYAKYFTKGREGDGYKISFDCAISDNQELEVIKNVILRQAAYLYENREMYLTQHSEENWSVNYDLINTPMEFKRILAPLRHPNLGVL